jgi:hypothetical protein
MGVAHEPRGPILLDFDIKDEDRTTLDGALRIGTRPDRLWGVELEGASTGSLRREWSEIFGDEVMAAALIDRLVHHCHLVTIRGNSYRMRQHTDL